MFLEDRDRLPTGTAFDPDQPGEIEKLLAMAPISDRQSASRCIQRLAVKTENRPLLSRLVGHLFNPSGDLANPEGILVNFERFVEAGSRVPDLLETLNQSPRAIEILASLFSGSQFLTEILIHRPEQVKSLLAHKRLARPKEFGQLRAEATRAASAESVPDKLDALRRYQRQELLRIGTCDLLGLFDLGTLTRQLSNLADALIQTCLEIAASLVGKPPDGFAVIAMGKLGGQELNYSSDIDLLFISRVQKTEYIRLAEHLVEALGRVTAEGFLYRVDLRLRPWGRTGSLVSSLESHQVYLARHAQVWEKQALLKQRFVAGDEAVGKEFHSQSLPLLFTEPYEAVRQDVFAMKQRTEAFLRQQGRSWGEVKLGEGSIRDIEFTVQFLQLGYGAAKASILSPNTLQAIDRLADADCLMVEERRVLRDGYLFFRTVEHYLQMMHYQQTYTLPNDPEMLGQLALRLGFAGEKARELFVDRYERQRAAVRGVYLSIVGNHPMEKPRSHPPDGIPNLSEHLNRMDPSYLAAFSQEEVGRHAALVGKLHTDRLVEVEALPLEGVDQVGDPVPPGAWQVTIVAYDFPGELSLICGLLFVYNLNIDSGLVFTYEPLENGQPGRRAQDARRIIVDVFTVRYLNGSLPADLWPRYAADLESFLRLMRAGERREARGELAKRFAKKLGESSGAMPHLYPIEIHIDNETSEKYTILQIFTQDTVGFLYELTNALALHRIYISQVKVESRGSLISDTLFVTDADGRKVTDPARQRELRAAIVLVKHFTHLLPGSANPEAALLHFRAFIEKLFQQPGWPDEVASLERPEVLGALAQVLGESDFLWEDFLRMQYESLFPVVRDIEELKADKPKNALEAELATVLASPQDQPLDPIFGAGWRAALNAFKDQELFRIDMRHILGYSEAFEQFSRELTDLAEVVVAAATRLCEEELITQYGPPMQEDGQPCRLAVCALGKCGARELGFASDIELMFVYQGKGRTRGPKETSAAEFYEKLVASFLSAVRARREGIFQVDLQLRPYGKAGSLAVSLDSFRSYFAPQGAAWAYERQALVKLRAVAGDNELGRQIEALRDELVYTGEAFDVTAMRAMRERQVRHLVAGGTFNAKFSPGGLIDVEYLVQGLQIAYGHTHPALRQTNTRLAIAALAEAGILSPEDATRLRKAHTFLRWLIDSLRVVRGNAKDLTVPPAGSPEFEYLTRRLQYGKDINRLQEELGRFTNDVLELNRLLL